MLEGRRAKETHIDIEKRGRRRQKSKQNNRSTSWNGCINDICTWSKWIHVKTTWIYLYQLQTVLFLSSCLLFSKEEKKLNEIKYKRANIYRKWSRRATTHKMCAQCSCSSVFTFSHFFDVLLWPNEFMFPFIELYLFGSFLFVSSKNWNFFDFLFYCNYLLWRGEGVSS